MTRPIPQAALDLIKASEGLRRTAYRCPAGIPTIGYGHTEGVTAADVARGRTLSPAEAEHLLAQDIAGFAALVDGELVEPATDDEFGAMVALAFNIGPGWTGKRKPPGARDGFRQSSVLACHNRGDRQGAAAAFALWNKVTVDGRRTVSAGLVTRRAREAALYLGRAEDGVPQAVAAPAALKPTGRSSTARAGFGGLTLATLTTAASQASEARGAVRDLLSGLELPTAHPAWLVSGILAAALAYVLHRWLLDRRGAE